MTTLRAPFPYVGGKSRVAAEVWVRFGDVPNLVEPFFGSGAVLLARPNFDPARHIETVNDADAMIANFYRALQHDPEAVVHFCDWPVNEVDLHARHHWLIDRRAAVEELMADPDAYDAKIAGWWVWGISQWIGSGWCVAPTRKRPHVADLGRGVHRGSLQPSHKMPHLGDLGMGVHRKRPILAGPAGDSTPVGEREGLYAYFEALAQRLRRVRVCCGDWTRVMGPSVTWRHGLTAVFLDPPYSHSERKSNLYAVETDCAADVRAWCLENGNNLLLRIALCGYRGEGHEALEARGWVRYDWKASGGYGSQGQGRGRANSEREAIWFSPFCCNETPIDRYLREQTPE